MASTFKRGSTTPKSFSVGPSGQVVRTGGGASIGSPSTPSTPYSGTVYIYKGKEYYSEADVKNAIASNILESPKVQEIIKKQGGSSETVYIYGGSTYTSPSEVQAQIQKETAKQQVQQTSSQQTQQGFIQPTQNIPGLLPFTAKPFSMSSKWLESDVVEGETSFGGSSFGGSSYSAMVRGGILPSVSAKEESKVSKKGGLVVQKVTDYARGFLGFETSKEKAARLELGKPVSQVDYSKLGTEEQYKLTLVPYWKSKKAFESQEMKFKETELLFKTQEEKVKSLSYEVEAGKLSPKKGKEAEFAKEYGAYESLYGKYTKEYGVSEKLYKPYSESTKELNKISKAEPVYIESATPLIYQSPTKWAKSFGRGAVEQSKWQLTTVGKAVKEYSMPALIYKSAKGKTPKTIWTEYKGFAEERGKALKESKNVSSYYTGMGYAISLVPVPGASVAGGLLVTAGSSAKGFQETSTSKLTGKEAIKIAGTSAAEGALFAVVGKAAGGLGGFATKKVGDLAVKEGGSRLVKGMAGFVSKYSPNIGKYAKNLVDTYFMGMVGGETVKLSTETYSGFKTGEWTPAARTGIGLGSSLAGYGLGSYALGKPLKRIPKEGETVRKIDVKESEKLTGIDLTKQAQPEMIYEGNIFQPEVKPSKIKQPKVKPVEISITGSLIHEPIKSTRRVTVAPMTSEIQIRPSKGKVQDITLKALTITRPIKGVDIGFGVGRGKAIEPMELPKTSTYELIGYQKGIPQYMFKMPKQEQNIYGWQRVSPIDYVRYARKTGELNAKVLPRESFIKLGYTGKVAASYITHPFGFEGGRAEKPYLMMREDLPQKYWQPVTAHEVVHHKTPKFILDSKTLGKLPYRYRPTEILAFGLQNYYAKKGFKIPITGKPSAMGLEEASGMGNIINLGLPEVKGKGGKRVKEQPSVMITTSEFAKPLITSPGAMPSYLRVLTEPKGRYYTEVFFEATRKGEKAGIKVKGKVTGVTSLSKGDLVTSLTAPELKTIEKVGMDYFPSGIDRNVIITQKGTKRAFSVSEGELMVIKKGKVQKTERIEPTRDISRQIMTFKGGEETYQVWKGFGAGLSDKKLKFADTTTFIRLGKPKGIIDEGYMPSGVMKTKGVKSRVTPALSREVTEQIARAFIEPSPKAKPGKISRQKPSFTRGRRLTQEEMFQGLSTQPPFIEYGEGYAFPSGSVRRGRGAVEIIGYGERGIIPKSLELGFPKAFVGESLFGGTKNLFKDTNLFGFKTNIRERQTIKGPSDLFRPKDIIGQKDLVTPIEIPGEKIIDITKQDYGQKQDLLTKQDLFTGFDFPISPVKPLRGPFPVPFPMFFPGGGGLEGGRGGRTKGRTYQYTPNLIGIEFGRAIKKAPKGSRIWSGFELRPVVRGGL